MDSYYFSASNSSGYRVIVIYNVDSNELQIILEAPEQLIIGWSIDNDVKYIYDACKRYNLKQINYQYLDMQKVYMDIFELTNQPSLETVCLNHNIAVKKAHKSDDDAFLTMLVSKIICKKLEITLPELFEKYKEKRLEEGQIVIFNFN